MSNLVAPGSTNVLRGVFLRLCEAHFAPPEPVKAGKREEGEPSLVDALLDRLTLRTLPEAYVVLLQTSDGVTSFAPTAEAAIAARTSVSGSLLTIEEAEFDAGVPAGSPERFLWFAPDARFSYFWTRSRDIFKAVWAGVQADPVAALQHHPFGTFEVAPHRLIPLLSQVEMRDVNRSKVEGLLLAGARDQSEAAIQGTHDGDTLKGRFAAPAEFQDDARYVVASSSSLRALYLAELAARLVQDTRREAAEEEAIFGAAEGLIGAARNQLRNPQLDQSLDVVHRGGVSYRTEPWMAKYYEYAYACASARVERNLFRSAINVRTNDPSWKAAAVTIFEQHGVRHAAEDEEGQLRPRPPTFGALRYFDFYDFGFSQERALWRAQWQLSRTTIEKRMAALRARLGTFLGQQAPYLRFVQEACAHGERDLTRLERLHRWYFSTTLAAGHRWWSDFDVESDEVWTRLETYLGWQATTMDKVGEVLGHYYGDLEAVLQHNEVLGEAVADFERLMSKLHRYNARFAGKQVERQFGEGMRLEADFERMEVVIHNAGDGPPLRIGPVHFLVEVERVTEAIEVEVPRNRGRGRKRYRTALRERKVARAFVPDVPFKQFQHWPGWLAGFGDSLALALAIKSFSDDWKKKDRVTVMCKVGMNAAQSLDSVGSALHVLRHGGKALPWFIKFAGPTGALIEAYYNVKDGLILLFDGEESDVVRSLEQGEEVQAWAQFAKGWVLVSSAAPGVAGAVTAAATAVNGGMAGLAAAGGLSATVMTPLSIGLIAGAIVVVGLELFLHVRNGPPDIMDPFEEELLEACKTEFGTVSEARYEVSRTADGVLARARVAEDVLSRHVV